jgi:hypothetical protein
MRSDQGGDSRRSGSVFGARVGAVGGTHNTCRRARFRRSFGRGRRLPRLLVLLRPERHFRACG